MKNAWLLHGTGGSDKDYFWFEDTKEFLEENGYSVWWPLLPNTNSPNLVETRNFIEENMPGVTEETIIIGHSSACPLILHLMEYFQVKVKQVILVSGYYQKISEEANSMLPERFNWDLIKSKANEIVIINSDNDPWGCDDKQARPAAEQLGAKFILMPGEGHMGSLTFNQPFREFPLIKETIGNK